MLILGKASCASVTFYSPFSVAFLAQARRHFKYQLLERYSNLRLLASLQGPSSAGHIVLDERIGHYISGHTNKMLAITLMPLLLAAAPLASASPFTFLANQRQQPKGTLAAATWAEIITVTSPATTATTPTAIPSPVTKRPKETNSPLVELRDGTFAASLGSDDNDDDDTAATAATATTAPTAAVLAADQAQTTAKPTDDPEADADLAREGYSQVTYYTCEAFATTTHCGWHVPVVHVSLAGRLQTVGAAAVLGAMGVGLLVGW